MIMKKTVITKSFLLTLAGVIVTTAIWAQASPAATATGKVNGANVTIKYSSPSVKGRKVFGELVPYDKVWRAGANEATIIEIDKDVKVEGKSLPAGKYSLYAIPGDKEWTIIFNKETGQWGIKRTGETTRDAAKDALVVKVKPAKSKALAERLVYEINDKGIVLRWENTDVPISIK
jgi:hypothetical protein